MPIVAYRHGRKAQPLADGINFEHKIILIYILLSYSHAAASYIRGASQTEPQQSQASSRGVLLQANAVSPPPPPPLAAKSPGPSVGQPLSTSNNLEGGNCSDTQVLLNLINSYRALHGAPALLWNASLAAESKSYAEALADAQCDMIHGAGGECLYSMSSYPRPDWSCRRSIDAWYSESKLYIFNVPNPFTVNNDRGVGHFVQLVWRSSTTVGCGIAQGEVPMSLMPGGVGGCKVVVCRFRPGFRANNAAFVANVLPRVA